jgi:hypothetical protein
MQESSALGMVPGDGTEVLQRGVGYTYEQGGLRGRVGKERKQTDVLLHYPPSKAQCHDVRGPPGGCQVHSSEGD